MQNIRRSNFGSSRANVNYPIPVPEHMNMDDIAYMSDEELATQWRDMDESRQKIVNCNMDATPWEIELAYLRREQLIRRERRDAHDEYLKMLKNQPDFSCEDNYPVADLDNSAFTSLLPMDY